MNEARFLLPIEDFSKAQAFKDAEGRMFVKVRASDTKPDRSKGSDWVAERVTKNFIRKMSDQANGKLGKDFILNDCHGRAFGFGKAVEGEVTPNDELIVKFELNVDYPEARQLFKEIEDGKCIKQASIGGVTTKAYRQFDKDVGGIVKYLDDGLLDEISVTHPGKAANPRSAFLEAITKHNAESIKWDSTPLLDAEGKETTAEALALSLGVTPESLDESLEKAWSDAAREAAKKAKSLGAKHIGSEGNTHYFESSSPSFHAAQLAVHLKREGHEAGTSGFMGHVSAHATIDGTKNRFVFHPIETKKSLPPELAKAVEDIVATIEPENRLAAIRKAVSDHAAAAGLAATSAQPDAATFGKSERTTTMDITALTKELAEVVRKNPEATGEDIARAITEWGVTKEAEQVKKADQDAQHAEAAAAARAALKESSDFMEAAQNKQIAKQFEEVTAALKAVTESQKATTDLVLKLAQGGQIEKHACPIPECKKEFVRKDDLIKHIDDEHVSVRKDAVDDALRKDTGNGAGFDGDAMAKSIAKGIADALAAQARSTNGGGLQEVSEGVIAEVRKNAKDPEAVTKAVQQQLHEGKMSPSDAIAAAMLSTKQFEVLNPNG